MKILTLLLLSSCAFNVYKEYEYTEQGCRNICAYEDRRVKKVTDISCYCSDTYKRK